ncbi:MAG: hypothetical protein WDN24_14130 [Sphingomonas sp.]
MIISASGPVAARPDIVDAGFAGAEIGPGAPPRRIALIDLADAARPLHRHQQHRRRAQHLERDPQDRARAAAVEQHAQPRDIARRPDLLALDDDSGHQRIERRIGKARCLAAQLGGEHRPALALREPPAALARGIGIGAVDVDVDSRNLEAAAESPADGPCSTVRAP